MVDAGAGTSLFVQRGGSGSPVVLLHGYVESGDMWGPLAEQLARTYTVIVPDLPGLARSWRATGDYSKKSQARAIRAIVTGLGFDQAVVVGHDLGGMVAYAYAAQLPTKVTRLVILEAVPPGIEPWSEILKIPGVWHFNFRGPEAEQLVKGRERTYFDRFWNDFSVTTSKIDVIARNHYASQYAAPGAMGAGFAQFAAFEQDAKDNTEFARRRLSMPVLAIGGDHADRAFGPAVAAAMRLLAIDVREGTVPAAGHWLLEENPDVTVKLVVDFVQR